MFATRQIAVALGLLHAVDYARQREYNGSMKTMLKNLIVFLVVLTAMLLLGGCVKGVVGGANTVVEGAGGSGSMTGADTESEKDFEVEGGEIIIPQGVVVFRAGEIDLEYKEFWDRMNSVDTSSDSYAEMHSKADPVFYEALACFTKADGESTDDYGGVYVNEDGTYTICVVGDRTPIVSEYIVYRRVESSYNFLKSMLNEVVKLIDEFIQESQQNYDTNLAIWIMSIDTVFNRNEIYLEKAKGIPIIIERLKEKDLFKADSLVFHVEKNGLVLN